MIVTEHIPSPASRFTTLSIWDDLEEAWHLAARQFVQTRYERVDWYHETACYCTCPGEDEHTNRTGNNHCRIYLDADPVPTIHCQHESCAPTVDAHNEVLRGWWRDAMSGLGLNLGPEEQKALKNELRRREGQAAVEYQQRNQERAHLNELRNWARTNRRAILAERPWPAAQILADSPTDIPTDVTEHWRLVLSRYDEGDTLWIADDVSHSGEWPGGRVFTDRFQAVSDWLSRPPSNVPGIFICPAVLTKGAIRRSNANVVKRPFLIVESDTLNRDEVGAVFQWMISQGSRLRFIVDTGSKSLHGWFECPDEDYLKCLKVILPELGIDPKVLTTSQPVRLPGADHPRTGRPQHLIYCDLLP